LPCPQAVQAMMRAKKKNVIFIALVSFKETKVAIIGLKGKRVSFEYF